MHALMRHAASRVSRVTVRLPKWLPALALALAWASTLPLNLTARANKGCMVESGNYMAFGNYDPMTNSSLDLQGRVSYRCYNPNNQDSNGNGSYDDDDDDDDDNGNGGGKLIVQISISAGNAGNYNRYMNGSGDRLHYNLFLDPQRQAVWGDGTGGTRFYSEHAQPNNKLVTVPVYGRVFGAQDIGAGLYFDQLIVTLEF